MEVEDIVNIELSSDGIYIDLADGSAVIIRPKVSEKNRDCVDVHIQILNKRGERVKTILTEY